MLSRAERIGIRAWVALVVVLGVAVLVRRMTWETALVIGLVPQWIAAMWIVGSTVPNRRNKDEHQ